jgi:hypothetical protein
MLQAEDTHSSKCTGTRKQYRILLCRPPPLCLEPVCFTPAHALTRPSGVRRGSSSRSFLPSIHRAPPRFASPAWALSYGRTPSTTHPGPLRSRALLASPPLHPDLTALTSHSSPPMCASKFNVRCPLSATHPRRRCPPRFIMAAPPPLPSRALLPVLSP